MSAVLFESWSKPNASEIDLPAAPSDPGSNLLIESCQSPMQLVHLARLNTLGQMAASLAHELNQPLGAIALQAELLARQAQAGKQLTAEAVFRAAEFLCRQAHRAGDIIRRIRQFARKAAPGHTRLAIREVIGEALSLLENQLLHEGICVQRKIPDTLPAIRGDPIQIGQVLLNLVRNAIEAMASRAAGEKHLRIHAEERPTEVVIEVSDTGCGLSPQVREHLFKAFFSTKPTGVGIGLAISRLIVESHGGRLWAAPNLPRGTTFAFSLPRAEPACYGD